MKILYYYYSSTHCTDCTYKAWLYVLALFFFATSASLVLGNSRSISILAYDTLASQTVSNGYRAVSSHPNLIIVARVDKDRHTRFRKAGYDAIDRICAYYYSLREKPVVAQVKPGFLRDLIPGMSV